MQEEIVDVVGQRTQPERRMFQLEAQQCEGNVQLRIIGCENLLDCPRRQFPHRGVARDEIIVVPIDEIVCEASTEDDERSCYKHHRHPYVRRAHKHGSKCITRTLVFRRSK